MKITQWRDKLQLFKRISDCLPIKIKKLSNNCKNTSEESIKMIKKVNNSNKEFKNCWVRIQPLETKLENLNKT